MKITDRLPRQWPKNWPLQLLPPISWAAQCPTYREAEPALIDAALQRSQRRTTGNWYVFAASRDVRPDRPFGTTMAGIEIVAWRDRERRLRVGPRGCPHLGADLATGAVHDGMLMCRWHGLPLSGRTCEFGWKPLPSYDDGILAWVRLDDIGDEIPSDTPVIPARPDGPTVHAVARVDGVCEPADIIANRLDPWHGSWFHPYSFSRLEVVSTPTEQDDRFVVSVTFRLGRLGVPVTAEFMCTDARTIVMRIVEGEGAGSIVETHASPIGLDSDGRARTAVIEAVVAQSDRTGFHHARRAAALITPLMRYVALRLWRDDMTYAERRYRLRVTKAGR